MINSGIITGLAGYSSEGVGPFVNKAASPAVKALLAFGLGAAMLFAMPGGHAEAKTPHHIAHARNFLARFKLPIPLPTPQQVVSKVTSQVAQGTSQTPDQLIDKIRQWVADNAVADLDIAIALAAKSNDNVTSKCWADLRTFAVAVQSLPSLATPDAAQGTASAPTTGTPATAPAAVLPKLHVATDVELATELLINLQPNSAMVVDCQGVANFYKVTAANLVTGVVTGALSLSTLAPVLP
jgi:hypothetical protein